MKQTSSLILSDVFVRSANRAAKPRACEVKESMTNSNCASQPSQFVCFCMLSPCKTISYCFWGGCAAAWPHQSPVAPPNGNESSRHLHDIIYGCPLEQPWLPTQSPRPFSALETVAFSGLYSTKLNVKHPRNPWGMNSLFFTFTTFSHLSGRPIGFAKQRTQISLAGNLATCTSQNANSILHRLQEKNRYRHGQNMQINHARSSMAGKTFQIPRMLEAEMSWNVVLLASLLDIGNNNSVQLVVPQLNWYSRLKTKRSLSNWRHCLEPSARDLSVLFTLQTLTTSDAAAWIQL